MTESVLRNIVSKFEADELIKAGVSYRGLCLIIYRKHAALKHASRSNAAPILLVAYGQKTSINNELLKP